MTDSQFLYITPEEKEFQEFPFYLKIGPGKQARQFRYLLRKLPLKVEPIWVLGKEGQRIRLPFTLKELVGQEKEWYERLLCRITSRQQLTAAALAPRLEAVFPKENLCDGSLIPMLLLDEILAFFLEQKKIPKKEVQIVLFSGEPVYTQFLLKLLGSQYNFLTLVLEEPEQQEEYEAYLEQLYEEYGLVVSVQNTQNMEPFGDIFIDISGNTKKVYRSIPEDGLILDLFRKNDLRYLNSRRENLELYYRFTFGQDVPLPGGLIQAALCQESTWLMRGELWAYYQDLKKAELKLLELNGQGV